MRSALLMLLTTLISACAVVPDSADEAALRERRDKPAVHADLVQAMLSQGQNYAALAHIEELERKSGSRSDELRYLRATAQYKLGELEAAEGHYRALLNGDHAGQAWHGLGLIAARRDLAEAVGYFNRAITARPTDPQIRNDLGYTLLQAGRLTEARHHLATATELDADAVQARNNLVLSFLVDDQHQRAQKLASSFQIDAAQWRQLQAESRVMRRLIAQRADEFQAMPASAPTQESSTDEEKPIDPRRRGVPGVYSHRR